MMHEIEPGIPPRRDTTGWGARPENLRPIPDNFSRYHTEIAEKGPCVWEFKERCNVDIS